MRLVMFLLLAAGWPTGRDALQAKYEIVSNKFLTWQEALDQCRLINMTLVEIDSKSDEKELKRYAEQHTTILNKFSWIGAERIKDNFGFQSLWITTGKRIDSTYKIYEYESKTDARICYAFHVDFYYLIEIYCTEKLPFICQKPAIPASVTITTEEPATIATTTTTNAAVTVPVPIAVAHQFRAFTERRVSWPDAVNGCAQHNMTLASVESAIEQQLLEECLDAAMAASGGRHPDEAPYGDPAYFWIGATKEKAPAALDDDEDQWMWTGGRSSNNNNSNSSGWRNGTFKNWGDYYPDGNRCAVVQHPLGDWESHPCGHFHPFVCRT